MPQGMVAWALRLVLACAVALVSVGCASVGYYAHVAHGQAALLAHRRPIERVLRDPATDPSLAARLERALAARRFASARLDLPDNRSYTRYVALDRPYVVWDVFATPPFSVDALPQCFPVAGCVAYRGFFDHARAKADAAVLRGKGYDVDIGGVSAYSTLGWFADPIFSSMLARDDDDELAATIFHELAHQKIYAKGDTQFNESFATFVQRQGLVQWRASRGLPPPDDRDTRMDEGFTALALDLRRRLAALYASPAFRAADVAAKRAAKAAAIDAFRQRYAAWRDREWPGDHRYDAWVHGPINNASLLDFGLYDGWTPGFAVLFAQAHGRWPDFYRRIRVLAAMPKATRDAELATLSSSDAARIAIERATSDATRHP